MIIEVKLRPQVPWGWCHVTLPSVAARMLRLTVGIQKAVTIILGEILVAMATPCQRHLEGCLQWTRM